MSFQSNCIPQRHVCSRGCANYFIHLRCALLYAQQSTPIIHGEVNLNTIYTSSGAQGFLLLPKWPFSSDADTTAVRSGRNKPILDIQTDLYDLGLVTLSLLTNRSTQELSGKVSSNRLSEVFAERIPPLPEEIRQVIARALQPDRNERFPNIEAFKAALLNAVIFMPGEPVPSPLPSRSTPIHSPLEKQGSPDSSEDAVPKTPPATQPMSTAPIRRRVPWGLLILVATAGFVLLFFAAVI